MNRKVILSFLTLMASASAMAQLNGNGYYRVQGKEKSRYIIMIDNKSKGYSNQAADIDALLSVKPFSRVADDPSSVIYIEKVGSQYNLKAQGTDAHAAVGYYLNLKTVTNSGKTYYQASATAKGITLTLYDKNTNQTEARLGTTGTAAYSLWDVQPISATNDNNYFGVTAEFTAGGRQYTSLFTSFPYTFASSGMKAFTVTKIDGDMAIWQEFSGKVAAGTPVILQCAGAASSANRLNIEMQDGSKPSGNLLKGVFFNNMDVNWIAEDMELYENGQGSIPYHFNATAYDPATMRLLGTTSQGKLGFVKSSVKYVPRNRAYITVPAGSPDEITLVTQAEYDAAIAADAVTVTARSFSRPYGDPNPTFTYDVTGTGTLKGEPVITCAAVQSSPVGSYPIVVSKGTVSNRTFTPVNGMLTVTKAPLTVRARSYTIKQNEALPQFEVDYTGFKLGETSAVLTQQPTVSCNVPADKAPGTYVISVAGAEAQNYGMGYIAGTLTIQKADPITVTANSVSKVYGDALPELTYTVSGGTLSGQPQLVCEAKADSPVGTYAITVSQGTLQSYPNLVFVDAVLTVTQAPLTITAGGPYTMKQTDARPQFVPTFEGFKLGETSAVLTRQPELATDAPADNTPGEYVVTVGGAEAQNYAISYVNGRLVITEADPIVITANDAAMTYGDDVPQLTYTVSGGELQGEPVVSCEATSLSPAGTYDIVVTAGTVVYPNLKLVGATLTVGQAPLTATVGSYAREEGDPNPEFVITYEGFRNGDTPDVFTVAPVAACEATEDSPAGTYAITLSGGEARNYVFTYVDGQLTVSVKNAILAVAAWPVPVDVYSLTGHIVRRQATSLAGLPKGVYIVQGRKVVLR